MDEFFMNIFKDKKCTYLQKSRQNVNPNTISCEEFSFLYLVRFKRKPFVRIAKILKKKNYCERN